MPTTFELGQLVADVFVFSTKRPLSAKRPLSVNSAGYSTKWTLGQLGTLGTFGQTDEAVFGDIRWYSVVFSAKRSQFNLVITDVEIGQIKHSSCLSCCNTTLVLQYSCCNLERELSSSPLWGAKMCAQSEKTV